MGHEHASRFWAETKRHHTLAKHFERNIEVTHPDYVTSDGTGHRLIAHCVWPATTVIYRKYRGDNVTSF